MPVAPATHLDHVRAVVVQVPQLAVVALMRPPEGILPQDLVLLEVRPHAPPLIVGQRVPVLTPRHTPVTARETSEHHKPASLREQIPRPRQIPQLGRIELHTPLPFLRNGGWAGGRAQRTRSDTLPTRSSTEVEGVQDTGRGRAQSRSVGTTTATERLASTMCPKSTQRWTTRVTRKAREPRCWNLQSRTTWESKTSHGDGSHKKGTSNNDSSGLLPRLTLRNAAELGTPSNSGHQRPERVPEPPARRLKDQRHHRLELEAQRRFFLPPLAKRSPLRTPTGPNPPPSGTEC